MQHIMLGRQGEKAAADYLAARGYTIVATKYRAAAGEIDLIARQRKLIVFIEVKTRRTTRYGRPAEAVTYRKQRKIIQTARCYLACKKLLDSPCRFDVVEVLVSCENCFTVCHIVNAFGE